MSDRRVLLFIFSLSFALTSAEMFSSAPFELILSKFEVYDSFLESIEERIRQHLTKIQIELYDIKAENTTSFECVELYGDLTPIHQLSSSFNIRVDEYQNRKEIIAGYLKLNSNVSFH